MQGAGHNFSSYQASRHWWKQDKSTWSWCSICSPCLGSIRNENWSHRLTDHKSLMIMLISILSLLNRVVWLVLFLMEFANLSNVLLLISQHAQKFRSLGIPVSQDDIFSSSFAAAMYLKVNNFPSQKKVYVIGGEGILEVL